MPCIYVYLTIANVVYKFGNRKASYAMKKSFYCVFVRTENNLIAFLGPSNCVNTQYAALSGAMNKLGK